MARRSSAVLALAVALATAANASAGEVRVGILPPDGWLRVDPQGTNLLAAWRDSATRRPYQNLTLAHDDSAEPLATYVATTRRALALSLPGSKPTSSRIAICGTRPAYDLVAVGTYRGLPVRIEEVVTDIGHKKFIGTYTRPVREASARVAETSLHSICPER